MFRRLRPATVLPLAVGLVALSALPALATGGMESTPQAGTPAFAEWGSATTGELDGVPFTVSGCTTPALADADLSGADFVPAGGPVTTTWTCAEAWNVTVSFTEVVDGLDLYLVGARDGVCADSTYTFGTDTAATVTAGSGLAGATLVGSTLTVPFEVVTSGVVHVDGEVGELVIASTARADATPAFTLATLHVEPPTPSTEAPPASVADDAAVADAGAQRGAALVTPAFTC